jgi:hypothetical protein
MIGDTLYIVAKSASNNLWRATVTPKPPTAEPRPLPRWVITAPTEQELEATLAQHFSAVASRKGESAEPGC